jgi:hypothetical protein
MSRRKCRRYRDSLPEAALALVLTTVGSLGILAGYAALCVAYGVASLMDFVDEQFERKVSVRRAFRYLTYARYAILTAPLFIRTRGHLGRTRRPQDSDAVALLWPNL